MRNADWGGGEGGSQPCQNPNVKRLPKIGTHCNSLDEVINLKHYSLNLVELNESIIYFTHKQNVHNFRLLKTETYKEGNG